MFKRKLIEVLKATINSLEDDLTAEKRKVTERDKLIKNLQEEQVILLNNAAELRESKHYEKLKNIERIIKVEELKKTPAVYILDKIKEVLVSDYQSIN